MPFSCRPCNSGLISYATGRLDLPLINEVNEGLTGLYIVAIVSGILGNHVWQLEVAYLKIKWSELYIYSMLAFVFISSIKRFGN
jgi:hypothetical protein